MTASRAEKMKVLVLAGWYPNDENALSGVFVREQAAALAEQCDVAVLYVHIGGTRAKVHIEEKDRLLVARAGLRVNTRASNKIEHLANLVHLTFGYAACVLKAYRRLVATWGRPDMVHAHVFYPAGVGALLLHVFAGLPYVITEHSSECLAEDGGFFRSRGRTIRVLMRLAGKRACGVIAVSSKLGRALVDCGLCDSFVVVPNVVRTCDAYAHAHGQAAQPRRIASLSILTDQSKNISGLIDAVALVAEHRADFQLHIAGDGRDRAMLEARADERGLLGSRIVFRGALDRNEALRFLASSAFTVVSSRFETFSVVAAETLMCGRPVLATRCGGPEEFISEGLGRLVAEGDVVALAQGLESMLDECDDYDTLYIRTCAAEMFSASTVIARLLDVYEASLCRP
ncbi:MAG: glycosyltransferase [Coriobacteriia bacterium]|nr:glycosyltransferase [Coriobacteriia bacterium]